MRRMLLARQFLISYGHEMQFVQEFPGKAFPEKAQVRFIKD